MQRVQKNVWLLIRTENSPKAAQWRESVQVPRLWKDVLSTGQSESASTHPQWRKTISVQSVQKEVCRDMFLSVRCSFPVQVSGKDFSEQANLKRTCALVYCWKIFSVYAMQI